MIRRLFLPLLLSVALAVPLAADDHPNTDRGFSAEKAFQIGEIDNVNVFNGNLVLTIPIGGAYPAGGALSYGLTLVYNSNAWDFQERDDQITGNTYTQALPQRTANAGLGWTLTLGRLLPPGTQGNDTGLWVYQGADAADHVFYPTLHDGDADEPGDTLATQIVSYTRDGSYLRKRINLTDLTVEFPDGKVQHFDSAGNLKQIEDRFSNSVSVNCTSLLCTLDDHQGRVQKIFFQTLTQDNQPVNLVQRVELTTFRGGSPAVYAFSYSPATIARPCPGNDPLLHTTVQVQMLTGVSLPDGSNGYQMPLADYITGVGNTGPGCRSSGELRGLRLPTLGRLEWTYQNYTFPAESGKLYRQSSSGVATRLQRDAAGTVLGTWTYQTSLGSPVQTLPVPIYAELTNKLIDPLGHWTLHYFSVYATFPSGVWSAFDYSLPFTRNGNDGAGRYLSSETHDKFGTLLRSTYVLYDRDQVPGLQTSKHAFQDQINTNRRQQTMRTVYSDDGNRFADVTSSDFDGLGHYRTETTGGNFPAANVRTTTTTFNPARGTYQVDPSTNQPAPGHTFTMWPASQAWILGTYTSRRIDEAGTTAFSIACFDAATGFLQRLRTLKNSGTGESPNDGLAAYSQTQGNLTAEQSFGGDGQSLAVNGTTCSMALPAPEYEIDHTYQSGARATSQYLGVSFRSLDQDIDASSGLPIHSRDTAGLATGYKYDSLGRLTWSQPVTSGQGSWTEYVYTPATSAAALANVLIRRRQNGAETAPVLAQSQIFFDSFGRVWQEKQLLPSGVWNVRETLYDPAGNKASVSEVQAGTPSQKTLFSGYDPFGRASTIQPPDGAAHAVTLRYFGVRVMDRTVQIATAAGTETPATTTEAYDRQGRLSKVTESSGAGGAGVITTYGYDVGNRLASVSTTASVAGTAVTQNRFFNYDNLGFLRSETHPEKGLSGNGTVTYPSYDSRGHAQRKIDGPHDLDFIYDAAERLKWVQEHGGRPLKSFTYRDFNSGSDLSEGKLKTAVRYNYVTVNTTVLTVPMTETYTYSGRDGRVSQRDTVSSTGESFTQGFTYNDLGLVSALNYPLCTHAGCTAPAVFSDVPQGAPFQREIEAIYPGVTSGCGTTPLSYCPNSNITRGEMAVFLLRAKEGPAYQPPACTPVFTDVPCTNNPFAPWINEIHNRGITGGCSTIPLMYCPNDNVTNAQMAVFLTVSLGVGVPACPAPPFTDVPCNSFAAAFIAEEARRQITTGCGGGNFCPSGLVTRAQMAGLLVHAFDIPVKIDAATPRAVQLAYTQGLLTGVASGAITYGTLSYYPNLLVNQVAHRNGVTETQGNDPNEIRRPSSFSATGPYPGWSSGVYAYDGAGNIKTIGTASFTYDAVNRLVASTQYDGPTGGGSPKQQSYTFDPFGNLTSIAGISGRMTPTAPQTNRLNGTGTQYDGAGNLTNWNGAIYQYDAFNQMTTMTSGTEYWAYLYTADDERVWSYDLMRGLSHWTLRDLGAKVLRDYLNNAGKWSVAADYIYRDGLLLAAETQTGQRHFHLDHLGTPRLITRAGGEKVAYHVYYPFGEEATAYNQDAERMKFTGHERDLASPGGAGDDLDYMHARHESPVTGRFLSVDAVGGAPLAPQSWNRYSYARENPLKFLDHDGREVRLANDVSRSLTAMRLMVPPGVRSAITTKQDSSGRAVVAIKGEARSADINFQNLQKAVNSPGIVQINQTGTFDSIAFEMKGNEQTTSLGARDLKGITLPTSGTAGDGPVTSTTKGVMQVHIDSSLSAADQATAIAAELAGHVVPGLTGQGAAVPDSEEHHAREDPAIEAARRNSEQTDPPQ